MNHNTIIFPVIILLLVNVISGCKENVLETSGCPDNVTVLESFTTPEEQNIIIYEDGTAYVNNNGLCNFVLQYFDPNFVQDNYVTNASGTFLITNSGELFPTKNNFVEDFENYSTFLDLFITSVSDTNLYWDSFTLQSPSNPEVSDYIALRQCIFNRSCTFIDNKIELVTDPTNVLNRVLKFTSVAPSANMITAKSSISSSLNYYTKDTEVWYQADYYIESGMPFSLVDFENSYFVQSSGPRVVIRNNKLAIENKFGAKQNFMNTSEISIPQNQWFTIKVHLKYSNTNNGIIELWQDGTLLISTLGINLPTSNSIQNRLEVGVTSTPIGCILLFDNMIISEIPF